MQKAVSEIVAALPSTAGSIELSAHGVQLKDVPKDYELKLINPETEGAFIVAKKVYGKVVVTLYVDVEREV